VCCTIQKVVEEKAEGLQRLKTARGIVDGLSLTKNCGGLWKKRVILFDTKSRKENDDSDVSRRNDAFRMNFPLQVPLAPWICAM
jgi:hypothetical protein